MATATRIRVRVCLACGQENDASALRCVHCKQLLEPEQHRGPIRSAALPTRTTLPVRNTRWVLIGLLLGCLPGVLVYVLAHSAWLGALPTAVTGPVVPLLVGGEGIWAVITATNTQQKSRRLLAGGILIGLCLSLLVRYSIPTSVYM